jgi:creatinine amidohydrolase
MSVEPVLYAELTPRQFRARLAAAPIAYLPLGTLEWHGEHLPLGSDGIQSQGFFIGLARRVGGIVLPMLFAAPDMRQDHEGREYYGMDILSYPDAPPQQLAGSAYWMPQELFEQVLDSIVHQLARAGFKIVVAHGHAPSVCAFLGRKIDWENKYSIRVLTCWREDESDGFGIQTDHAAANETSLVMALRPDLVAMENLDPDPSVPPLGVGGDDPRVHASADRGHRSISMQVERMANLLKQTLAEMQKGDSCDEPPDRD